MRILFVCIILTSICSCKQKLEEPYSFFGDHDLKNGNYKLVGIGMEGQQINGFKNFSIDDSNTLVEMQKKWVFDHKINAMSCGFDYEIQLLKDSILINQGFVNLECGYLNTKQQKWLYFPPEYLSNYTSVFKQL